MARKRTRTSRASEADARGAFDRSHQDDLDFDAVPESELADFGDSGKRGFEQAWGDDSQLTNSADPAAQFASDPEDTKGRDLNTRSKRGIVALVLIVLVGVGLGVAVQGGFLDSRSEDSDDRLNATPTLGAPGEERTFEDGPLTARLPIAGTAGDFFQTSPDGEPAPAGDPIAGLPAEVTAGSVLWAERLHIAVLGTGVGTSLDDGQCIVASLVREDLVPIDVAGTGECDETLTEATGDRLACLGDDLVLLEVWVDDPSTAATPPPTELVRVRVEQREDDGRIDSVRSRLSIPSVASGDPLVSVSAAIAGAPGDTITVSGPTAVSATCELVDRSGVQVRLLPS